MLKTEIDEGGTPIAICNNLLLAGHLIVARCLHVITMEEARKEEWKCPACGQDSKEVWTPTKAVCEVVSG